MSVVLILSEIYQRDLQDFLDSNISTRVLLEPGVWTLLR